MKLRLFLGLGPFHHRGPWMRKLRQVHICEVHISRHTTRNRRGRPGLHGLQKTRCAFWGCDPGLWHLPRRVVGLAATTFAYLSMCMFVFLSIFPCSVLLLNLVSIRS
jgi:hypothetical protein